MGLNCKVVSSSFTGAPSLLHDDVRPGLHKSPYSPPSCLYRKTQIEVISLTLTACHTHLSTFCTAVCHKICDILQLRPSSGRDSTILQVVGLTPCQSPYYPFITGANDQQRRASPSKSKYISMVCWQTSIVWDVCMCQHYILLSKNSPKSTNLGFIKRLAKRKQKI